MQSAMPTLAFLKTEAAHHGAYPANDVFFLQGGIDQVNVLLNIGEYETETT